MSWRCSSRQTREFSLRVDKSWWWVKGMNFLQSTLVHVWCRFYKFLLAWDLLSRICLSLKSKFFSWFSFWLSSTERNESASSGWQNSHGFWERVHNGGGHEIWWFQGAWLRGRSQGKDFFLKLYFSPYSGSCIHAGHSFNRWLWLAFRLLFPRTFQWRSYGRPPSPFVRPRKRRGGMRFALPPFLSK